MAEDNETPPLTLGMYGSEFNAKHHYGLYCGQMNSGVKGHNAGWYNARGEKLGWGDLSEANVEKLMDRLPVGECFFVLSESDSYWDFVVDVGQFGWTAKTAPSEKFPGIEYVLKRACFVVVKHATIYVNDYPPASERHDTRGNKITRVRSWEELLRFGQVVDGAFVLGATAAPSRSS